MCCGSVVARLKERRSEGAVNRYGGTKPSVQLRWNSSTNLNLMEQTSNLLHMNEDHRMEMVQEHLPCSGSYISKGQCWQCHSVKNLMFG
jgi:hypothetical protein